ncbi:glycyl-radical enzyme activating protein [Photobacterium sagamiensis]
MRTTLFLKGCPLNCFWCHNPESISVKPEVWNVAKKCIGCNECLKVCSMKAVRRTNSGLSINRQLCNACGECVEHCPANSMQLVGTEWSVEEAFNYLIRDKAFYERSGGGVTISGGEPTMHSRFVGLLFERLKHAGIHTALDTCGLAKQSAYEQLLPYTDLLLWDIKTIDDGDHKKYTSRSNKKIIENLFFVAEYIRSNPNTRLWIRTPLVPGATATNNNLLSIAKFINENLSDVVSRWDLCLFNNTCEPKYSRLNIDWQLAGHSLISDQQLHKFKRLIEQIPSLSGKTHFSGLLRKG